MSVHPHSPRDLPPHVVEALGKLNKAETDLLLRLLRAMLSLKHSGRLVIYIVGGALAALILIAQALDAVKKLLPPKFAILLIAALPLAGAAGTLAREGHSNPWLLSWIPTECCVTNDCCWEVGRTELTPLPHDRWRVVSTGQELYRKDWSPDGRYYRCACDYDAGSGKWIRHQGATTRCVFVPLNVT